MCPVSTRFEMRESLLGRLSPDWQCPACEHDRFVVTDEFTDLMSRSGLEDQKASGSMPCLGIICLQCGHVSLHAVAVLNGTLNEGLTG